MVKRLGAVLVLLAILVGGIAVGWRYWDLRRASLLPDGIAMANGRIEANQVEIASKLPGRVVELQPQEGDTVKAGEVVARLDAAEYEAQLRQSQAEAERVLQALAIAQSTLESRKSDLVFAQQQFERVSVLARKGFSPVERLDHIH